MTRCNVISGKYAGRNDVDFNILEIGAEFTKDNDFKEILGFKTKLRHYKVIEDDEYNTSYEEVKSI